MLSSAAFALLGLVAFLAFCLGRALAAYVKFHPPQSVLCPRDLRRATVTLDAGQAALSTVLDRLSLRVRTCSRWTGGRGACDQKCTQLILPDVDDA